MRMRTPQRIEQAEQAATAQSKSSDECICFPQKESPFVCFPIEEEIAAKVKCPLHGERFKPLFHIYVPKWLRAKQWKLLWSHHSEQYRKAWFVSFPPELWPASEEKYENEPLFLRLKDGTRILPYGPESISLAITA